MSAKNDNHNPTVEALKERYNLAGLAVAVGVSVFFPPVLPFVLGAAAVAEAGYLIAVPRSGWYARRLSQRHDSEAERKRGRLKHTLFPAIRHEVQDRFSNLEISRKSIARQMPVQPEWFGQLLAKLDYLLDKFLDFASKESEFRAYLRSVLDEAMREESATGTHPGGFVKSHSAKSRWVEEPPSDPAEAWVQAVVDKVQHHYETEVADLNQQRTRDADDLTTNAVLDKRVDVIQRRRDYLNQIGKITINLNHQMELMEDTFGLISDEIRARPPEQILADIDEVIGRTDSLTELLQGFSPPPTIAASTSAEQALSS